MDTTSQQHSILIRIFERFLTGDDKMIEAIQHFDGSFKLTTNRWQFILPDLFDFCCQHSPDISKLDYKSFRKLLYQYPTNQIISADQGLFELEEEQGHIDRNIYVLTRQQKI